jgi:hypothetical protein
MAKKDTMMEAEMPVTDMPMPVDMGGMPTPSEGSVNISITKSKFDELHSIAMQLAGAVDALAAEIEAQKATADVIEGNAPAAESAMAASEEDFLNSIASEGSMR